MRRSELDSEVVAKLGTLIGSVPTLLAVGVSLSLPGCSVTGLERPEQARTDATRFPAALWAVTGDVAAGLKALRRALAPGARLVLLSAIQPSVLHRLRALVSGEKVRSPSLEELCNALLLSGYLLPSAHDTLRGTYVVSARVPARVDALDAFFTQLDASPSR